MSTIPVAVPDSEGPAVLLLFLPWRDKFLPAGEIELPKWSCYSLCLERCGKHGGWIWGHRRAIRIKCLELITLLEFTLSLVSHPFCTHISLQIIACRYIKGIFLYLLYQWKFYNGRSLLCFYCFCAQQAYKTVANKLFGQTTDLRTWADILWWCVCNTNTLHFCQKLGHLTAPSGEVWAPSCLFHTSAQKLQNSQSLHSVLQLCLI